MESTNSYDDIKGMLNKVRKIQSSTKMFQQYGLMQEQVGTEEPMNPSLNPEQSSQSNETGDEDIAVINDVEVKINSNDPEDLQLSDEEKGKISQLIDDFRTEVSETAEFGQLNIYDTSAKLEGKIIDIGLTFILSTGDDTGFYLSNSSLLKIDDNSFAVINKLRVFQVKYSNIINDLLVTRSST